MSCRSYITWLSRNVGGTGFTRTELLEAVDNAQLRILGQDLRMMRVLPDPYLTTVDQTYSYVASTSIFDSIGGTQGSLSGDIRKVNRIFTYEPVEYGLLADYGRTRTDRPPVHASPESSDAIDIPFESIESSGPGKADAKIILWHANNPGASTTKYMCECYKWPTSLTSEAQDITVPITYQRSLLFYGVLLELEQSEYGNVQYAQQMYDKWMLEFKYSQSNAPTTSGTSTPVRPC